MYTIKITFDIDTRHLKLGHVTRYKAISIVLLLFVPLLMYMFVMYCVLNA